MGMGQNQGQLVEPCGSMSAYVKIDRATAGERKNDKKTNTNRIAGGGKWMTKCRALTRSDTKIEHQPQLKISIVTFCGTATKYLGLWL